MIQKRQYSKLWVNGFKNFFLVFFALRYPLILINKYILLCILSVAESTEPSIYTRGTTFWNLPEVDGT
jgi:hypothetical protein